MTKPVDYNSISYNGQNICLSAHTHELATIVPYDTSSIIRDGHKFVDQAQSQDYHSTLCLWGEFFTKLQVVYCRWLLTNPLLIHVCGLHSPSPTPIKQGEWLWKPLHPPTRVDELQLGICWLHFHHKSTTWRQFCEKTTSEHSASSINYTWRTSTCTQALLSTLLFVDHQKVSRWNLLYNNLKFK